MYTNRKLYHVLFALFTLSLFACSKKLDTFLPGAVDAGVNFYNASETLNTVDSLRSGNYVFIDDSTLKYPPLFSQFARDGREFPGRIGTGQSSSSYSSVDYMRISAGTHRIMFTGRNALQLMADTTIDFQQGTFTCVYLVESNASDSTYNLITVTEDRKPAAAGKVKVHIINLCPDITSLNSFRLDEDGSSTTAEMPQDMTVGAVSNYIELDTASAIHNKIFIGFFTGSDKDNPLLTTAVPAESGRSFAILIQGFKDFASRRIVTRRSTDGSLGYGIVNVTPNLRVNIRATY